MGDKNKKDCLYFDLWHNQDLKLDICQNMLNYGGSFVKALAVCIQRADWQNLNKLERAFESYIIEYHPDKWAARNARR